AKRLPARRRTMPTVSSECRWTVVGPGSDAKHVVCRCACGTVKEVQKSNLGRGSLSCGCLSREIAKESRTGRQDKPEFRAWVGIKKLSRKGVYVYERWLSSF